MEVGHQKGPSYYYKLGTFSRPLLPHPPGRRRGGDGANNPSCLLDKVSIKIPKLWGSESFRVGAHHNSTGTEVPSPGTLVDLALCTSLSGTFPVSMTITGKHVSQSSMSHCNK